jgi:formate--tetrahydrofolate ligase
MAFKTDIEIAREAVKLPIQAIGDKLGIPSEHLLPYGHDKAKIGQDFIDSLEGRPDGKLILVTAINPTPGRRGQDDDDGRPGRRAERDRQEGGDLHPRGKPWPELRHEGGRGRRRARAGRADGRDEPSFHRRLPRDHGGAQPALAAMIDNHIYWGNSLEIDERRIVWRRVMDMNDRALRDIVVGLGGVPNGFARQTGFDITVASEVMAILCLARDLDDLQKRLGDIVVAYRRDRTPIHCRDIKADGAMTVLLRDAMQPNLVQTLENNPAFVHGGPFANIAHGCNSVIATRTALKLGDYVVTEAGFGADLGAEKFFDIKCRKAGLTPAAAVIVATVRAMKMNGGVAKADLGAENVEAVQKGCPNLGRHIANVKSFGVPVVVAINHFHSDTEDEIAAVRDYCTAHGAEAILCRHWAEGSAGVTELATRVAEIADAGVSSFAPLYDDDMGLFQKIDTIAKRIYHADEAIADKSIRDQLKAWEAAGYGHLPICMAKTQYSFSTDPNLRGAPEGHTVPVREVRLSAGAGFIVAICGEIMTMPGLPRTPAAETIRFNEAGFVEGLF